MSSYREFVKENFHSLGNMPATEKMKKLGEMWKKHKGKATMDKGKGVAGGKMKVRKSSKLSKAMKSVGVAGGKMKVRKSSKSSKAMKSVGGAIPWNWEFIDPSRGISEQLQDYFIKGLVGQANPLGKATLKQVQKYGGDEQTLEFNHRYWDAKDESNRLLNAVAVDNQKRADEPSFGEQLASTAVSSLASALPEMVAAGFKKRGRPSKKVSGGQIVGGSAVAGSNVTVVPDVPLAMKAKEMTDKEKMKLKKAMHKLEMKSHHKKLTKVQDKKLKELHNLHAGNLLDV